MSKWITRLNSFEIEDQFDDVAKVEQVLKEMNALGFRLVQVIPQTSTRTGSSVTNGLWLFFETEPLR